MIKVQVFHFCSPPRGKRAPHMRGCDALDVTIDIEMPFAPYVGLMFKPTPGADYLKVTHVFWSVERPGWVEAHCDDDDARCMPFREAMAEGWNVLK